MLLFSAGGASTLGRLPCHQVDSPLRLISWDIDLFGALQEDFEFLAARARILHRTPRKRSPARSIGERVEH
jgi:hypothetical protein